MLLSEKYNFIFIHIYKNAGTSIVNSLRPFVIRNHFWKVHKKITNLGLPSPFIEPHPYHSHITASEIIDVIGYEKFTSYYSFAIVRNPWDWQVSLYKYMLKLQTHHQHELVKSLGSFENYIVWRCENEIRYQRDFLYSKNNKLLVNFVGRYENLEADFTHICRKIGISTSLLKLNVSNSKPYQDYYTNKTRELVSRTFAPDIETFNYSF